MAVTIVVGTQWGDEGKGKIVDLLSQEADIVIRFNGGNNAGHTIKNEWGEFALHLIPAGIFNPDAHCLIERGVVIHPPTLVDEMAELSRRRVSLKRLKVSPFAHLVMPWHLAEDEARERGKKIGTTLRGIGPCYQDKVGRHHALRMGDLRDAAGFSARFDELYAFRFGELKAKYGTITVPILEEVRSKYLACRDVLLPHIGDTSEILLRALRGRRAILLEGAQGTLLDPDFGSYPYVTSSQTTSTAACALTGISPREVTRIIGVTKAYVTRVGGGPFPTEIRAQEGEMLRRYGREYGATTGRPRRCGWLDIPLLQYSCRVNHLTEIALTKIDVLGLIPQILVCTEYVNAVFADMASLEAMQPLYGKEFKGWGSLEGCRFKDELPPEARQYLKFITKVTGVPVALTSIGGQRKEIITL